MEKIKSFKTYKLNIPLIMPFTISSGSHKQLENIIFEIKLNNGNIGFGEAPIASHITGETIEKTIKNLNNFGEKIIGKPINEIFSLLRFALENLNDNRAALLAVETALLDIFTKEQNIPLWKFFGEKPKKIKTDITIVIGKEKDAYEFAKKTYSLGFDMFKIKTGVDFDEDIKRIIAVKKVAPKANFFIDGNCAYDVNEFIKFLSVLKKYSLYPVIVEQPLKKEDFEGMKFLTKKLRIPVCADETAYDLKDVYEIAKNKIASMINIKFTKFGISQALDVYKIARAKNIKLMIGQMVESHIASLLAVSFASVLNGFEIIDLDIPFFLKEGKIKYNKKIISKNGVYDISLVKKGIGAEIYKI